MQNYPEEGVLGDMGVDVGVCEGVSLAVAAVMGEEMARIRKMEGELRRKVGHFLGFSV